MIMTSIVKTHSRTYDICRTLNNEIIKDSHHKYIFFLLPFVYFFLYGRYGYNDIDGEFILGLSWRIVQGEIPYRDFIWIRPPLSPVLHSLTLFFLPANYQVIFERFLFYMFVWLYSFSAAYALDRFFDLGQMRLNKYLLGSIAFIFSAHNFPPMPFHTLDGLICAGAGVFFLTRRDGYMSLFVGISFMFFSALAKQSFYLMPVFGLLFIAVVYGWKKGALSLLYFALLFLLFIAALYQTHLLNNFIMQVTGQTKIRDFIDAALFKYANISPLFPLITAGLFMVLIKTARLRSVDINYGWATVILVSLIILLNTLHYIYAEDKSALYPLWDYPQLLFIISLFVGIREFEIKNKNMTVLLLLLAVSWSASISFGYPSPLLFAAPLLFGIIYITYHYFHFSRMRVLYNILLIGGLIMFYIANQYPYMDSPRRLLTYDMGEIFPKLSYIKSSRETYDKYAELKSLVEKYGNNFKVIPNMMMANYLTNTKSPLPLDWITNIEMNFHPDLIIKRLDGSGAYVFLENNPLVVVDSETFIVGSPIKKHLEKEWTRIGTYRFFSVYKR
jgi:hypothetical protein